MSMAWQVLSHTAPWEKLCLFLGGFLALVQGAWAQGLVV